MLIGAARLSYILNGFKVDIEQILQSRILKYQAKMENEINQIHYVDHMSEKMVMFRLKRRLIFRIDIVSKLMQTKPCFMSMCQLQSQKIC